MDRLTAMQVFTEVATSGSFTATADKLDMSRAMVTRYVGEMENWLGARLLQRTTRRVTLTDAGEACLRRCQQMMALVADVEEETTIQSHGALRGQLRLTCSMSFAYASLSTLLTDFLQQHPQLKIDLNVSDGAVNLVDARMDLAIRISNEPDPMLVSRPLGRCDSVLVAAPAYLARHGTPDTPQALVTHRCLSHANVGKSIWHFTRGPDSVQVGVVNHFSANDATVLMQATLAGGGIAMLPTYLTEPLVAQGQLQVLLLDWHLPSLTIYALYPSRKNLSPAVRALLDFLVMRLTHLQAP